MQSNINLRICADGLRVYIKNEYLQLKRRFETVCLTSLLLSTGSVLENKLTTEFKMLERMILSPILFTTKHVITKRKQKVKLSVSSLVYILLYTGIRY